MINTPILLLLISGPSYATLTPSIQAKATSKVIIIASDSNNSIMASVVATGPSTPAKTSGGSKWGIYKGTLQTQLMYTVPPNYNLTTTGQYVDIWDENTSITSPYMGNSCVITGAGCDNNLSVIQPIPYTDSLGVYGMNSPVREVRVSENFARYLYTIPTGSTFSRTVNSCNTTTAYSASSGGRCIDQSTGVWRKQVHEIQKQGQMTFQKNALSLVAHVDSNGVPNIAPGSSSLCSIATVNGIDGITCEIARYNLSLSATAPNYMWLNLAVQNSEFNTRITDSDLQFTYANTGWKQRTQRISLDAVPLGNQSIRVFLSNHALKTLALINSTVRYPTFIVQLSNTQAPQSGYFDFPIDARIDILPREYTISIQSANGISNPYGKGLVGKEVISFPYEISSSGPTSASKITISITQNKGTSFHGMCTFHPPGDIHSPVPVPARLRFNSIKVGDNYIHPIQCDGTPVDLSQLGIKNSHPPMGWLGGTTDYFTLNLEFNLKDSMTNWTIDNQQWMGEVTQSGIITVKGYWH